MTGVKNQRDDDWIQFQGPGIVDVGPLSWFTGTSSALLKYRLWLDLSVVEKACTWSLRTDGTFTGIFQYLTVFDILCYRHISVGIRQFFRLQNRHNDNIFTESMNVLKCSCCVQNQDLCDVHEIFNTQPGHLHCLRFSSSSVSLHESWVTFELI